MCSPMSKSGEIEAKNGGQSDCPLFFGKGLVIHRNYPCNKVLAADGDNGYALPHSERNPDTVPRSTASAPEGTAKGTNGDKRGQTDKKVLTP